MGKTILGKLLLVMIVLQAGLSASLFAETGSAPTVLDLQKRFGALYACPEENGLSTFSAMVGSNQVRALAQSVRLNEPEMKLFFSSVRHFRVRVKHNNADTGQGGALKDFVDGLAQSIEGFWQSYVTIGYPNMFDEVPATATISVTEGGTRIHYADQTPNHFVNLDFDRDFRLVLMEAYDSGTGMRSLLKPEWEKIAGRFVLSGLETQFLNKDETQPHFVTSCRIDNKPMQGFALPTHVVMQARDGYQGKASDFFFEFTFGPYELGIDDTANP